MEPCSLLFPDIKNINKLCGSVWISEKGGKPCLSFIALWRTRIVLKEVRSLYKY